MNISLDSLLDVIDGNQEVSIKPEPAPLIKTDENELLAKYRCMNDKGKQRLLERADELIELGYVAKGDELKEA